jgi:hypothetical protein
MSILVIPSLVVALEVHWYPDQKRGVYTLCYDNNGLQGDTYLIAEEDAANETAAWAAAVCEAACRVLREPTNPKQTTTKGKPMIRLILEDQAPVKSLTNPEFSSFFVLLSEWEQYQKDLTAPQIRPISDLATVDPETEVATFRWPRRDLEEWGVAIPKALVKSMFKMFAPDGEFRKGKAAELFPVDPGAVKAIQAFADLLNMEPCDVLEMVAADGHIHDEGSWFALQCRVAQEVVDNRKVVEFSWGGHQWLADASTVWRKAGLQPELGRILTADEHKATAILAPKLLDQIELVKKKEGNHTWKRVGLNLNMDTGYVIPARNEVLLKDRRVLWGTYGADGSVFRCYAALEGDEIMAVVGDGNVRWRE